MKKIILTFSVIFLSFAAMAQDGWSFRAYTYGGASFESLKAVHPEYGFGVGLYKDLSKNFSLGIDATPTKTFTFKGDEVTEYYYVPISLSLQGRILDTRFSPVVSVSAGYSFMIPRTGDYTPLRNNNALDYKWKDYTNPDLLDENGELKFASKEDYADYLTKEEGVEGLYKWDKEKEEYVFDESATDAYLRTFSNGDTRYFEKGIDYVQNGWFFNFGIGCDYKISNYRVGLIAEAGLYQTFYGAILKNEKNEFEYFSQIDYLCREVEREVNGKTVSSFERGQKVLVNGKPTGAFYPKVSVKLYVAF